MPPGTDSPDVGRHDDEHLRRFVAARGAGDTDAMRVCWEELVITIFDRMDGLVAAAHKGRLNDDEHDQAVSLALSRFTFKLIHTFEGVSMGELVNATKTLASYICMDVQRASMAKRTVSLDHGWGADEDGGSSSAWEAAESQRRFELDEHTRDMDAFRDEALAQLPPRQREVVDLTFRGAAIEEICDQLDLTRDNAYQLRSRGLRKLAQRLRDHEDAS